MSLNPEQQAQLQAQLQQAVIACSERCLSFAAKWYELLHCRSYNGSDMC